MTRDDAAAFAAEWAAAWNRQDIESVLAHFAADVVFVSPTALAVTGAATVRGRDALAAYWRAALGRIRDLRFDVDRIVWDPDARELAIVYTSTIDGSSRRVSENLRFDADRRVVSAEVLHGVTADATA